MLNISILFLSTIFLLCFYIDQIQLDNLLFENEQYLKNEKVIGPDRNFTIDGFRIVTTYTIILRWKNSVQTEWKRWLYPFYKDAMLYRSLKYVYVLAHYENEVLENIRNISENFKYLPRKENSFPQFGIVTLFSEIIKIIDIFFEGEKLIQFSNNGHSLELFGGNNWETYESIISKNLIDKKYYPPTEIKDKNKELIEAMNILITNIKDEYKLKHNADENNEEECKIINFIL
ncbi:uncharacterized protein LOC126899244 [Daktulosphaira vitifoliae]|uniref:uncharacterized protein LOC126899244 n=1 Tax=Daktulosphaira vitifoliae TaxID=58002 RepID=UPI0021AA39D1|nr:uncharacterized protein LOC126899244 [Daktulosphaira vitifoliae]